MHSKNAAMNVRAAWLWLSIITLPSAAKLFETSGPVLSINLKGPLKASESLLSSSPSSTPDEKGAVATLSWLNPAILWTVRSTRPPLPEMIPSLRSVSGAVGYRFDDIRDMPSYIDSEAYFLTRAGPLNIYPNYEVKSGRTNVDITLTDKRNRWYGSAKLSSKAKRVVESLRCSFVTPYSISAMASLTVEPSYNLDRNEPSVRFIANSASGLTQAVLCWDLKDPTLKLVHAMDKRNTLSPEISLPTGKITFNWDIELDSGSIRARVDPSSFIQVKWTDQTHSGKWVTDFSLPMEGSGRPVAAAADIRVRRQFVF